MRYYLPPVFFGFLFALALLSYRSGHRLRAAQIGIIALLSALLFRTAAGRCSWSHTRYAVPLLGIAVVAFVLEPLLLRRRVIAAVVLAALLLFYFEVWPNSVGGAKSLAGWRGRQRHVGLVPYPFATGKGIYTSPDNASDLAKLNGFIESLGPRDRRILDISNERALYYLLQRRPATRCMEISMLSIPACSRRPWTAPCESACLRDPVGLSRTRELRRPLKPRSCPRPRCLDRRELPNADAALDGL